MGSAVCSPCAPVSLSVPNKGVGLGLALLRSNMTLPVGLYRHFSFAG